MSIPKIIECADLAGNPISAVMSFATSVGSIQVRTDQRGRVRVPATCVESGYVIVKPREPFWSAFVSFDDLDEGDHIRVSPIPLDIQAEAFWWMRLFDDCIGHSCCGMRLAVIDLASQGLNNVALLGITDADGVILDTSQYAAESHGYFVTQALVGWREAGALTGTDFQFVDVSAAGAEGKRIDPNAVLAAIVSLREDFDTDIINISLGYDPDEFADTPEALDAAAWTENLQYEIAQFSGLVVAAGGNEDCTRVMVPARFPEVIGVTGIASISAAFPNTRMELWKRIAEEEGSTGNSPSGERFFHIKGLTYGDEIDAAAPGAGVWLKGNDGRPVENEGSSFAAPIVTAALACAIARRKENDSNYVVSKDIIAEICVDVGLDSQKQGHGVPLNL